MRLHCWNRSGYDIDFDPNTGSASLIRLDSPRDDSTSPLGFAQFERRFLGPKVVFAIFLRGDSVVFSAGPRQWRLDQSGLRLVHSRSFPFLSRFSVIENGTVTFSILYTHIARLLLALIDPTYDRIDEETDFLLSFVAEYGSSTEWRTNALRQWSREPAV